MDKVLTSKPDHLNSTQGTHIVEKDNQLPSVVVVVLMYLDSIISKGVALSGNGERGGLGGFLCSSLL